MRVVAFHTGGKYSKEADRLLQSCHRLNIFPIVKEVSSQPDWDHAVAMKPMLLKWWRKILRGGLLYVDVDAVFHEDPTDYFDSLDCDFAAHWFQGPSSGYDRNRNDNQFLSGTMYFGDTERARLLLDEWLRVNVTRQANGNWKGGGQANLRDILERKTPLRFSLSKLKVVQLPGRYCYVFDKPWAYPKWEPKIIEHLIASRENRGISKGKINLARRRRIAEIEKEWAKKK